MSTFQVREWLTDDPIDARGIHAVVHCTRSYFAARLSVTDDSRVFVIDVDGLPDDGTRERAVDEIRRLMHLLEALEIAVLTAKADE